MSKLNKQIPVLLTSNLLSPIEWTSEDYAWAAGFFDGEGSISLKPQTNNKNSWSLDIQISQVQPEPLQKIQKMFGGTLIHRQQAGRNPIWAWRMYSIQAAIMLEKIRPYLIRKQKECNIAQEYILTIGKSGKPISTETLEKRQNLATTLRVLNDKG